MEWWQAVLDYVATFEWWQVFLGVLAVILAGILLGILVTYLFYRFVYKLRIPYTTLLSLFFNEISKKISTIYKVSQVTYLFYRFVYKLRIPFTTQSTTKQVEFYLPELLDEIVHNCTIAAEFSGGNLLPLKTDVWDAHQYSARELPANLLAELEHVYAHINLLNNLVWLSTVFSQRSYSLDDKYKKLLTRTVERLDKLRQTLQSASS